MPSARISSFTGRGRLRAALPLLAVVAGALLSQPAAATLTIDDDFWVLRAREAGTTFSALRIGGNGTELSQGCFTANGNFPCQNLDFLLEFEQDMDGDPDTFDITIGGSSGGTFLGIDVIALYAPTFVDAGFGESWDISSVSLPGAITGRMTVNGAGTGAQIVLDPITFTVVRNSVSPAIDTVDVVLTTQQNVMVPQGLCPIGNTTNGIDLDFATGFVKFQGSACLSDNIDFANGDFIDEDGSSQQFITFTLEGTVVPEPGTLLLMLSGLSGLGLIGRKRIRP